MKLLEQLRWYYVTRGIGALAAMYELLLDRSSERGTIIIAAFGLMGFDWVAKREGSSFSREELADYESERKRHHRSAEELQEIKDALKRRR